MPKPNQYQIENLHQLIHDIKSKCGNLSSAVGLLKQVPLKEESATLELMALEAHEFSQRISEFKKSLPKNQSI